MQLEDIRRLRSVRFLRLWNGEEAKVVLEYGG